MEEMKEMLDGMAYKLGVLAVIMIFFGAVTAIIIRYIPIPKELKNIILGITALIGVFVWFKIYF